MDYFKSAPFHRLFLFGGYPGLSGYQACAEVGSGGIFYFGTVVIGLLQV